MEMKKIWSYTIICFMSFFCHAQIADSIMERNPSIYYYLYTDDGIFSDELVLLFPDSSFYIERTAPMMSQYSMGRYTCHGDSLYLTSYQKLDTLDILKVEEYWNPAVAYSTIVVVDENNHVDYSFFLINGASDTLWTDSNWILKYDGKVAEVKLSVGEISHFSRYVVRSPNNNVFLIQVNSEEKTAYAGGSDIILENALFVRKGHSLYDYSCNFCNRELTPQTTIPQGAKLRHLRNKIGQKDNSVPYVDKDN